MIYKDISLSIPNDVMDIINILKYNGFEAFAVGGCVRDSLIDRTPEDWDITTNALPYNTKEIFLKLGCTIIEDGTDFGMIRVKYNLSFYEITTYRIDGSYTDKRRPDCVNFSSSIHEDLGRRDLTINALAYNPNVGLIDDFNGIEHLKSNLIITAGDPIHRYNEDLLRILRTFRFASQLNFTVHNSCILAIEHMVSIAKECNLNLFETVSNERIQNELNKLLLSNFPSIGLNYFLSTSIMDFIIPELSVLSCEEKKILTDSLQYENKDISISLSLLFYRLKTIYKENNIVENILKNLKYSNTIIKEVTTILKYSEKDELILTPSDLKGNSFNIEELNTLNNRIEIKKLLNKINDLELYFKLIKFTKNNKPYNHIKIHYMEWCAKDIIDKKEPYLLKHLAINGKDIKELGYNGPEVGKILNTLIEKVIENPSLNSKEKLISCL